MKITSRLIALSLLAGLLALSLPAFAQGTITPGEPLQGEYSGEEQIYSLSANRGQLVVIGMESEDFDNAVSIRQGATELASDDDSGESLNALLAYVFQDDGNFDIVAGASTFEEDQGPFTLTVDVFSPQKIEMGATVTLQPAADGSRQVFGVFDSTTGAVVNVWASTTGDEDIEVTLIGVDAEEVETDDDDGPGDNALIRRVVLPGDGLYLVAVERSFSDELITQPVEVTVEATEQLFLDAAPQKLLLGDGPGLPGTEVYTIDAVAGNTYRFIMTIEPIPDDVGGVRLELLDTDRFFEPELEARHTTRVSWDFVPTVGGRIRLDVHPNFFGADIATINYTIAMETNP